MYGTKLLHLHKAEATAVILRILIFKLLDRRREDRKFRTEWI